MGSQSRTGAANNQRLASRILFAQTLRHQIKGRALIAMVTSGADSVVKSPKKKAQSHHGAPLCLIKDLNKAHGDEVSVDIGHELIGAPVMGDRMIEGKDEPVSSSSFKLRINFARKPVTSGGSMNQQRKGYDVHQLAQSLLRTYYPKLKTEIMTYAICGARGFYKEEDIISPLADSTGELDEIMVNPITAPTFDTKLYGGNANSVNGDTGNALNAASIFDRTTMDKVSAHIQEMPFPPQACTMAAEDKPPATEPFYPMFITVKQWNQFRQSNPDFTALQANALERSRGFNHPIFKGECFMWDNILVRKYFLPVRFFTGNTVMVADDNDEATEHAENVPPNVTVDRAFLLGAQAACLAIGKNKVAGTTFRIHNEVYDGGDKKRAILSYLDGVAKTRFTNKSGRMQDYGVITLDTAVA